MKHAWLAPEAMIALALCGCPRPEPGAAPPSEVEGSTSAGDNTAGAGGAAGVTGKPSPPPPPERQPDVLPACNDSSFEFKLKGTAQDQVRSRFGPPAARESYRAVDRGGEFYVGVQHAYPSTDRKNWDVPIEEWTWTSGDCILTVWFHNPKGTWEVLDDVYWHKDTAF